MYERNARVEFARAGREMQESHAAALRARSEAMQPSIGDAKAIARRYKATAKQAKEDFKAA